MTNCAAAMRQWLITKDVQRKKIDGQAAVGDENVQEVPAQQAQGSV